MINIMQVVSKRKLLNHFVISILLLYTICKKYAFKIHLLKMEFNEDTYINWTARIKTIKDCNLCITVPLFSFSGSPTRCWVYSLELSKSLAFMWTIHWACQDWREDRSFLFQIKNTVGQFVQLQIVEGEKNEISPMEVRVWGKPTTKEWYYRNINSYMEITLSIYKFIYGYQDIHVSNKI